MDSRVARKMLRYVFFNLTHPKIGNLERITAYIKFVSNWYDYFLFRAGIKKQVRLLLRNGVVVDLKKGREGDLRDLIFGGILKKHGCDVKELSNDLYMVKYHGAKMKVTKRNLSLVYATFVGGEYSVLNTENKVVLDLGASIGDTPIYFLKFKKAKKVIAVEPFPDTFYMLKHNVRLNGLQDRCKFVRGAIGDHNGYFHLRNDDYSMYAELSNKKGGVRTPVFTLERLVEKLRLKDAVMKLDCEGYERAVILCSKREVLRKFSQIAIEAADKDIDHRLRDVGFRVKRPFLHPDITYAERK